MYSPEFQNTLPQKSIHDSNSKLMNDSESYFGEASCSENDMIKHILPRNYFKFEGGDHADDFSFSEGNVNKFYTNRTLH